jgi:hypothetical protein
VAAAKNPLVKNRFKRSNGDSDSYLIKDETVENISDVANNILRKFQIIVNLGIPQSYNRIKVTCVK